MMMMMIITMTTMNTYRMYIKQIIDFYFCLLITQCLHSTMLGILNEEGKKRSIKIAELNTNEKKKNPNELRELFIFIIKIRNT